VSHVTPTLSALGSPVTRRGFLKRTAAGSALLLLSRVGSLAAPARAQSASRHPRHLDLDRFTTLEALCDRIIWPADGAPTAREARVALRVDHEIGFQSAAFGRDMRDALTLIEYGGILEGKWKPFTKLPGKDQDAVIRGMIDSRFEVRRTAIIGLKTAIAFFYYADDRTWARTGYDGPWVPRRLALTEREFPFPIETEGVVRAAGLPRKEGAG
jgi:hypothetical protein